VNVLSARVLLTVTVVFSFCARALCVGAANPVATNATTTDGASFMRVTSRGAGPLVKGRRAMKRSPASE
jgi:hypothetical protein